MKIDFEYSAFRYIVQEIGDNDQWVEILDTGSLKKARKKRDEAMGRRIVWLVVEAKSGEIV